METTISGHGQFFSPHMVTVRYQEKNGSQHNKKAPMTKRREETKPQHWVLNIKHWPSLAPKSAIVVFLTDVLEQVHGLELGHVL